MTMIEIPLKSAEINGDRGTIALPLKDVLAVLERGLTTDVVWENHTCPVCCSQCVTLEMPDGQKVYIETPRCPGCGVLLVRGNDAQKVDD